MTRFKCFLLLVFSLFLFTTCEKNTPLINADTLVENEVDARIPPIEIEDVTATYNSKASPVNYEFNVYLCTIYAGSTSIHLYAQHISSGNVVYLGEAQQVGADDFHFRLTLVPTQIYINEQWAMRGQYSQSTFSNGTLCVASQLDQDCDTCHYFDMP